MENGISRKNKKDITIPMTSKTMEEFVSLKNIYFRRS